MEQSCIIEAYQKAIMYHGGISKRNHVAIHLATSVHFSQWHPWRMTASSAPAIGLRPLTRNPLHLDTPDAGRCP